MNDITEVKSIDYISGDFATGDSVFKITTKDEHAFSAKIELQQTAGLFWEDPAEIYREFNKKYNFTNEQLKYKAACVIRCDTAILYFIFTDRYIDDIFEKDAWDRLDWDLKKRSTICFVKFD